MRRLWLIMSIISMAVSIHAAPQSGLETGSGEYDYADPPTGKTVRIYYYKPSGYTPDSHVLIALHGDNRTAFAYRIEWKAYAEKLGCMLLVPHFSPEEFPGANGFQFGNVVRDGTDGNAEKPATNPEELWVFSLIDRLFDDFSIRETTNRTRYTIYGHSAGAQFVHRMLLFQGNSRIELAIAANAGWYLSLDAAIDWPFGLRGLDAIVKSENIDRYLSFPLVLALGDADLLDDHKLNTSEMAMRQGRNRFERGNNYFEACQEMARNREILFGWKRIIAPGVAHSNGGMAGALADYYPALWTAIDVVKPAFPPTVGRSLTEP